MEPDCVHSPVPGIRATSYRFAAGIPAFENHVRFRLLENPRFAPIVLLESEIDPSVRFACAPVHLLAPGYELELSAEELDLLGRPADASQLLVLAILTFREGRPPTANLLAPIVLNPAAAAGVQSVQCNPAYSHLHPLREETSCS
ncbi:MAG: flagellar assembly protein FliW [Bryobacteraceae bacterium]|nr:flagellar assembly protein FliW [Bryobacteraceae bacterium]